MNNSAKACKRFLVLTLIISLCTPWTTAIAYAAEAEKSRVTDSETAQSKDSSDTTQTNKDIDATRPKSAVPSEPTEPKMVVELKEDHIDLKNNGSSSEAVNYPALSSDRLAKLAALLPPMTSASEAPQKFEMPAYTRKPKLPTNIQQLEFPPKHVDASLQPQINNQVSRPPLHVTEITPEGSIENVKSCTIVFDQPMVPITTTDVSNATVPVKLEPQPPGTWRWLNTNTLAFETTGNSFFPNATTYKVTVTAGTKSEFGSQLVEAFSSSFTTPAPRVEVIIPKQSTLKSANVLRPVLVFRCNQPVNKKSVLERMHARKGRVEYALKQALLSDFANDPDLHAEVASYLSERNCVLVQPAVDFPKNSTVNLTAVPGIVGLEGPNPSELKFESKFITYGPLQIASNIKVKSLPQSNLLISFSNALSENDFKPSMVSVSPPIENFAVKVGKEVVETYGHDPTSILLTGKTVAGQTYRVNLSAEITDIYGQRLRGRKEIVNKVSAPKAVKLAHWNELSLSTPEVLRPLAAFNPMVPSKNPSFNIWSLNYKTIRISLYEAQTADWEKFQEASTQINVVSKENDHAFSNFHLFSTEEVTLDAQPEIWKKTSIDLSQMVESGRTHIVAVYEGVLPINERKLPNPNLWQAKYAQWIEYSPVDFSVVDDGKDFFVMVSNAVTGKPMEGANVVLIPSKIEHRTDKNGLAKFRFPPKQTAIEIKDGLIDSFAPKSPYSVDGYWSTNNDTGNFLWYHKSDRHLYRPGDQVFIKGWLRYLDWEDNNQRRRLPEGTWIKYSVISPSTRTKIAEDSIKLDADGSFNTTFNLPVDGELGTYQVSFTLEDPAQIRAAVKNSTMNFMVQEFRRPEFEFALQSNKSEMVMDDTARLSVDAHYQSGSPLQQGKIHWAVTTQYASFDYKPKNSGLGEFVFGDQISRSRRLVNARIGQHGEQYLSGNWHHSNYVDDNYFGLSIAKNYSSKSLEGKTDRAGQDALLVSCTELANPSAVTLHIESTVEDLNRQTWSKSSSLIVHPADLYVGANIKPAYDWSSKKTATFIVTDLQSNLQSGTPIDLELIYVRENPLDSTKNERIIIEKGQIVQTKDDGAVEYVMNATEAGNYLLIATIKDSKGRVNRTLCPFEVLTKESTDRKALDKILADKNKDKEKTTLVIECDKTSYHINDIARVKLKSDVANGHGFLFIQNNRIQDAIPFEMDGTECGVSFAVKENLFPGCHLSACYFSPKDSHLHQVTYASARISVPIEKYSLRLNVAAGKPDYQPGDTVKLNLVANDIDGAVSGAQIAVAVVDESVLALTNYKWDDPKSIFNAISGSYFGRFDTSQLRQKEQAPTPTQTELQRILTPPGPAALRQRTEGFPGSDNPRDLNLFQVEPTVIDERRYTSGRAERHQAASGPTEVKLRSDMNALAYFNPSIHTNGEGKATVSFKLPGNLTKYRVLAIASAGSKQFGEGSTTFQINLPLMVRPSLPRFLNYKDSCDFSFLVQNTTDKPVETELVVRAKDLILDQHKRSDQVAHVDMAGRKIFLPAQGRVEVRIPAKSETGTQSVIQSAIFGGGFSDAAQVIVPLQPPVTSETFATSGHVDENPIQEHLTLPPDLVREVGGLKVTTSSTAMQNLIDAGMYLRDYPFGCSEQLSARILGLSALKSLLTKFPDAGEIKVSEIQKLLEKDVEELCKRQLDDGDFGLWAKSNRYSSSFVTAQCLQALWISSQNGISVDKAKIENALRALKRGMRSRAYRHSTEIALRAQALNIRMQLGDADPTEAHRVLVSAIRETKDENETDPLKLTDVQTKLYRNMSLETMAWLYPVLATSEKTRDEAAEVRNVLLSHVSQTTENAEVQESLYGVDSYWLYYSRDRLPALVIDALIDAEPTNPLIPKLVKELLDRRQNGRWHNTQDNAQALVALSKYFEAYEKFAPDFVSRLWIGEGNDEIFSEEKFAGRSLTSKQLKIPMAYLADQPKKEAVTISKQGKGRLYYRLELKYAKNDPKVEATSRGFHIERTFEAFNEAGAETLKPDANGILHVKAGATVRVTLMVTNRGTRHHVALVDNIPAGFELVNDELIGNRSGQMRESVSARDAYWAEYTNLRDSRVEAFTTELGPGQYRLTYHARATQMGSFIIPPCKAEEMYNPESFGRTSAEFVSVE